MKLTWTPQATSQLVDIHEYIAGDNATDAADQARRIYETVQRLTTFPHLGHPGRVRGSRELAVAKTPYLIAYRISSDSIQILAVKHGAQLWPASFPP